jgi:hypothetical protein
MASGLMTLAYMAEMAIVFNVAYFELNDSRYIKAPKSEAEALQKEIAASDPGPNEATGWVVATTNIIDRLEKLFSETVGARQKAWYAKDKNGENPHKDWWAGKVFALYEKGWDRELCQEALILSGLALTLITILDRAWEGIDVQMKGLILISGIFFGCATLFWFLRWLFAACRWISWLMLLLAISAAGAYAGGIEYKSHWVMSTWWFFFAIFAGSLIAPATCVGVGRMMRTQLRACIMDAKREFEDIKKRPLDQAQLPTQ